MKRINAFLHLYGSLVVYFILYSLFWMYMGESYTCFTRGLISGFVGILGTLFFNVSILKPDFSKLTNKEEKTQ